jgi:hypothetical protein
MKAASSWIALILGALLGFIILVRMGQVWVPDDRSSPDWLMQWSGFVGVCLLGLAFLIASVAALRDRRRAGILFLSFTPIVALCLAYSGSTFQITGADGIAHFYLPWLRRVILFWLLFFLPFFPLLAVKRHRKLAVVLFVILAAIAGLSFGLSPWTWPLLGGLAFSTALFSIFGCLWLGTYKLGWPPLTAPRLRSPIRRVATIFAGCLLLASLDIAATFAFSMWPPASGFNVDCGGAPLFTQPLSPRHAVFTAQLIRVGHSRKEYGAWVGDWAVGRVQERFWGLPWSAPHFVLLTDNVFLEDQSYFVDGGRAEGLLTRFLPIVSAGPFGCNRTKPAVYAALELHVLHEARPANGPRIVGYARKFQSSNGWTPPMPNMPLADAEVSLTGPAGTTTVTTDKDGIYEVDGLPPDDYKIKLAVPDSQIAEDDVVKKESMLQNGLVEESFTAFWNGTVEGRVTDSKGGPAHVWVLLQQSDGKDLAPPIRSFVDSDKNGLFRIGKVPSGSYKLTINPYGPSEESPYARVNYSSEKHGEDAGVLKIAEGQHVKNIDFALSRLPERTVETRVTWPDGKTADGAWVYVAYEHTAAYQSLNKTVDFGKTDHDGIAHLHVFGDSRIRVFAEDIVDDKRSAESARYSAPVELDITKLPARLDLFLSASKLRDSP